MSNSSGNSHDDQSCITSFGGVSSPGRNPPQEPIGAWRGWRDFAGQQQALQSARLSQLYGALHQHYMLSCPFASLESGTRVLVSWVWEPTCEQGVADVCFKSASEVASELAELRRGTIDDHKSNEGGLLQLVGDCNLFWSSILHWHMHGTCMPIRHADAHFRQPLPPLAGRGDCQGSDPRIRRINEVLSLSWIQVPGEPAPAPDPHLSRPPGTFADLPHGWQDARRAWDKAFERASRIGYTVHCMFYCTRVGCAAGDQCRLRHDAKRRQRCESHSALERFSRRPPKRPANVPPRTGVTVWDSSGNAARVSRKIHPPAWNQGGGQGSSEAGDVLKLMALSYCIRFGRIAGKTKPSAYA